MPLHDDLLTLARHLVDRNPGAPIEADLRRGVSTAYYALFHLLVDEATNQLAGTAALRSRLSRAFGHNVMKQVCQEYAKLSAGPSGEYTMSTGDIIPSKLRDVTAAFVALQELRHKADYDVGTAITHLQAETELIRAETAFLDWSTVRTDPAAANFLMELLCRGIPRR